MPTIKTPIAEAAAATAAKAAQFYMCSRLI